VNLVFGASSLLIDHVTMTSCWGVILRAAFHTVLSHAYFEPANSCVGAGPAHDALLDIDGTISQSVFSTVTIATQFNGTPGVATNLIRQNYARDTLSVGDYFNFGSGSQYGVLATANAVNGKILYPSYPGATPAHILNDLSGGKVQSEYTVGGTSHVGPNFIVSANNGFPAFFGVQESPAQATSPIVITDSSDNVLWQLATNGTTVVGPGASYAGTNDGNPITMLTMDIAGDSYIILGPVTGGAIPSTAGGIVFNTSNGIANTEKARFYPSGGLTIGSSTNDPGVNQLQVVGLKTTGSAGGKKVVCVDTTTGVLYASSAGNSCAN
jgi:hypothetical protein